MNRKGWNNDGNKMGAVLCIQVASHSPGVSSHWVVETRVKLHLMDVLEIKQHFWQPHYMESTPFFPILCYWSRSFEDHQGVTQLWRLDIYVQYRKAVDTCEPGEVSLYCWQRVWNWNSFCGLCLHYFVILNVIGRKADGTGVQCHRQWTLPRICTSYWTQASLPDRHSRPVLWYEWP